MMMRELHLLIINRVLFVVILGTFVLKTGKLRLLVSPVLFPRNKSTTSEYVGTKSDTGSFFYIGRHIIILVASHKNSGIFYVKLCTRFCQHLA